MLSGSTPGLQKNLMFGHRRNLQNLCIYFIVEAGSAFYISEGPDDKKYVENLEKILKVKYPEIKYSRFCGELMKNAANISKTNLFISNDTGIMHLASGFDIPVIGLFGPTKAYEWGPVGKNKASIQGSGANINNIDINQILETSIGYLSV